MNLNWLRWLFRVTFCRAGHDWDACWKVSQPFKGYSLVTVGKVCSMCEQYVETVERIEAQLVIVDRRGNL